MKTEKAERRDKKLKRRKYLNLCKNSDMTFSLHLRNLSRQLKKALSHETDKKIS